MMPHCRVEETEKALQIPLNGRRAKIVWVVLQLQPRPFLYSVDNSEHPFEDSSWTHRSQRNNLKPGDLLGHHKRLLVEKKYRNIKRSISVEKVRIVDQLLKRELVIFVGPQSPVLHLGQ